ncbi:MAG TPA: tRNA (5-methylaminomethyl-2-thiouridine)(34)-methyltransferase MnmD [Puia sp.]|nr:tRNA (5-methylaminomethyl-2-thiouridine)(34)-methyltransferase MnmD [Puia sp.]
MQRKIIITGDGSHSIEMEGTNDIYHSRHGAIRESLHVFINSGLKSILDEYETLHIFEMGFGTGLNALLTFIEAEKNSQKIFYETIELFPLEKELSFLLNYCEELQPQNLKKIFDTMHTCEWGKQIELSASFYFKKNHSNLTDHLFSSSFNLIYYDAFAPNTQPELWTKEIFLKLFNALTVNGVLVTYCSKGEVRRNMQAAGFAVEKLPGPKGKREILRAVKMDRTGIAPD